MLRREDMTLLETALASVADSLARYSREATTRKQYAVDEMLLGEHRMHLLSQLTAASGELARYGDRLQWDRCRNLDGASLQLQEANLALKLKSASNGIRLYCDMLDTVRRDIYGDIRSRDPDPSPSVAGANVNYQDVGSPNPIGYQRASWPSEDSGEYQDVSGSKPYLAENLREQTSFAATSFTTGNERIKTTTNLESTVANGLDLEIVVANMLDPSLGENFNNGPSSEQFAPTTMSPRPPEILNAYSQTQLGRSPCVSGRSDQRDSTALDHRQGEYSETVSLAEVHSESFLAYTLAGEAVANGQTRGRSSVSAQVYLCRFCDDPGPFLNIRDVTTHEQMHLFQSN